MRKQKNRLNSMLSLPDKGQSKTSGPAGVLTRLFRKMLADLDIGPKRFDHYLEQYIYSSSEKSSSKKEQTSMRGNLMKEFIKHQMTWKVFAKGLLILQVAKFELAIKITRADGQTSIHSVTMDWGGTKDTKEFNDLLEQPDEKEDPGEYAPAIDGNLPLEMEHWYIWNPQTKIIYDDLGPIKLPPFQVPDTLPEIKAQLNRWRAMDKMTLVSIGMRIRTLAEKFYEGPSPEEVVKARNDQEGPANG